MPVWSLRLLSCSAKKRKSVFLEWSELPGVLCWKTQVAAKSVLQAIADAVLLKN